MSHPGGYPTSGLDDDEEDDDYHTATEEDEEDDSEYIYEIEEDGPGAGDDDDAEEEEDDDDDVDEGFLARLRRIIQETGELTRDDLATLLAVHNMGAARNMLRVVGESGLRRRQRTPPDPGRFPKVPSEEGRKLMSSGVFGSDDVGAAPKGGKTLQDRLLDRELGVGDSFVRQINREQIVQNMMPSAEPDLFIRYPEPVYSGQFSDDGNFFFSVVKDFKVRMYDTSNPYRWHYYKTAHFPFGHWTLTDASLSPDNRWLAISSMLPHVCLAPTDPSDTGDPYVLDLSNSGGTGRATGAYYRHNSHFTIYSVRYSGDGRELVAGTGDYSIVVFDIESRTVLHKIAGHSDDVNAVCFADHASPHILYSGSDDTTIKVWDRRSMADRRPACAFVGHVNGLTYIDSKGDGRYVLSNAKDNSMKLWDLRKAMSTDAFMRDDPMRHTRHRTTDYRYETFEDDDWFAHPLDNSVVTFRGHAVCSTLIRCHFSPPGSTNSRYVYSGSAAGKIYVWNLDATLAATLDVTPSADALAPGGWSGRWGRGPSVPIIREAFWHPNAPVLVASAWRDQARSSGFCSVHSYNESWDEDDHPQTGRAVNAKLERYMAAEDMEDDDYQS